MNKLLTLFSILIYQFATAQDNYYWVQLKDKNMNSYSINHPEEFLSKKAIQRRQMQHIQITSTDLPVSPAYITAVGKTGVKILSCSRWFNIITVLTDDETKLDVIKALPFVKGIKKINGSKTADPFSKYKQVQSFTVTSRATDVYVVDSLNYGPSYKQANQIGVTCLHKLGFLGQEVTIAVLDAGFFQVDVLHVFDSLRVNKRLLGTRDFVTGDTMVFEDYAHGMNVLSCMAGNLPGKIIGTAPKASYWLLRTEDAATETLQEELNWSIAAEFADSVGADIINSSLGYSVFDNPADNHTYADMDGNTTIVTKAADIAASRGIFVTCSAGNSGGAPWYKITAPADADSVLTVGAIDSLGMIATFSSRGLTADGRIKPNVVARGVRAVVAHTDGDITMYNGTSFSSPITAGAVACLLQANKSKSAMDLLQAIQKSSHQYASPDSIAGYGIPDFCKANELLTGISNPRALTNNLSVYPNPFHSAFHLYFSSTKDETIQVEICDLMGRMVSSQKLKANASNPVKINFSVDNELMAGVYIVRVITSENNFYKKIIKE